MLSEQRPPKAKILTKLGPHNTQHFKGLSSLGNPIAKGPSFPYTHFKKLEQGWAGRELTFPKGAERGGCPLTRCQPLWEWTGCDFGRICCSLSFQSYSHSKTKIPRTWCKQGQTPAWPFPGRYRRLRKTYLGASRIQGSQQQQEALLRGPACTFSSCPGHMLLGWQHRLASPDLFCMRHMSTQHKSRAALTIQPSCPRDPSRNAHWWKPPGTGERVREPPPASVAGARHSHWTPAART